MPASCCPTISVCPRWHSPCTVYLHNSHPCFVCVWACIEPCPSIDCCFRLQECYPCRILASHGIAAIQSTCIRPLQSHSHLVEARPGAFKLAGATYSAMQHGICSTPIDPSIYLLVIAGTTYLKYDNSAKLILMCA